MTVIEGKTAYPYITEFKKEPYKSFVLVEWRELGDFYVSSYNEIIDYYNYFSENLLNTKDLTLENIFWFLLLKKYLKEDDKKNNQKIYDFIKRCASNYENKLGFKFSPDSTKLPDIWSTYFGLCSLKLLGMLKEYLNSQGANQISEQIKNFILSHQKGKSFLHCFNTDCEIDKKNTTARTLYFVFEIFTLLGMDVRLKRQQFQGFIGDRKKDPSIIFKLLSLKYLDLDLNVKDKEIQYLHELQKENGGFSFKKVNGRIKTTFWLVYLLDNYSWLLDYSPVGIYSFINSNLNEILGSDSNKHPTKLMDLSKLIILLSIIWNKFIFEIERVIFRQIEQENYMDLNQIKKTFGLTHGIEDVISYINNRYTFNLKIIDNKIELNNFIRNLNQGEKIVIQELYEQLTDSYIVSLSDIYKKYKNSYSYEPLKLKEDIFPLINTMKKRNFFKGNIIKKKKFKTKFFFYLDFLLDKIIVSDTEIKTERLYYEKDLLKDIKNDIFNMTLRLKNISPQIKEEIESYLLLDEISYARDRLKFILRNASMDADFLNENIENSFNLDLYYFDVQTIFKSEIAQWTRVYSSLNNKLNEIDRNYQERIAEREYIRNLNLTLENLEIKIDVFNESINKKINNFKILLMETNEKPYSDEDFSLVIQEFEKIKNNINDFDKKIFEISQKIVTNEDQVIQKRNGVIHKWIVINEGLNGTIVYYSSGFDFFRGKLKELESMDKEIRKKLGIINQEAQLKIKENRFQDASELIKKESDSLLNNIAKYINDLQAVIKKELVKKEKLYLLYRSLHNISENLEEEIIEFIAEKNQSLKNRVITERNRTNVETFDNFVSQGIMKFKLKLSDYQKILEQSIDENKVKNVIKGYDKIENEFYASHKSFLEKLNDCKSLIKDFDENNVSIIHWNNFKEYFDHEINILKEEQINEIIKQRINAVAEEIKTDHINITDLERDIGIKRKDLISRINDLIDISKINAYVNQEENHVLLYTEYYYKNKELRNFIDSQLLKLNRETVGKLLALYDSSIRKRTLNINMLELQNRINDLHLEEQLRDQFNKKVLELQIQIESRQEYNETKKYLDSIIENSNLAINSIQKNLKLFTSLLNSIEDKINLLILEVNNSALELLEVIEKSPPNSYIKIKESSLKKWKIILNRFEQTQEKITDELKTSLHDSDSNKLASEIGEFLVKKKQEFLKEYDNKKDKISKELIILKDEAYREELIAYINNRKIYISQLLGTLQARVEDDIEIKEFKRANVKIHKRANNVESEIKKISKSIKSLVKEYNKESIGFATKNKYILDGFNNFTEEFLSILTEKVKSLEQLIIQSYVAMAIKAVSNEFLTIGFLNRELKIKRQSIQNHLISLISEEKLKGKYDPRFGVYYENPEILKNLNENELEVIKKMNFRMYMFLSKFKHFVSQYGSIFAFIAAILSITYTVFQFSGGNPAVVALPITVVLIILFYFFFKHGKEEKV